MLPTLALPLCWVGFGPVLLPVPLASPSGHPPPLAPLLITPPPPPSCSVLRPCLCALTTALAGLEGAPKGGHFYLPPTWLRSSSAPVLAGETVSWPALIRATHSLKVGRVEEPATKPGSPATARRHGRKEGGLWN